MKERVFLAGLAACALAWQLAEAPGAAGLKPLTVRPVHAVAEADRQGRPFFAVAGEPADLTFAVSGGRAPYRLAWVFGDQSPPEETRSVDGRCCSAGHAYRLPAGVYRGYRALEVRVTDAGGAVASARATVQVEGRPDGQLRRHLALGRALWRMRGRLRVRDGLAALPDAPNPLAAMGLHLQALANAGHGPFERGPDPYAEDARALLAALAAGLRPGAAGAAPTLTTGNTNYEVSIVLMALASVSRAGATVAVGGKEEALDNVCLRLAEHLLGGQAVPAGWRYHPGSAAPDYSVSQWPAIALEAFEATAGPRGQIPAATAGRLRDGKARLAGLLKASQHRSGGYGYTPSAETPPTFAMTAAALCCTSWAGLAYDDPLVLRLRGSLLEQWGTFELAATGTYAMYALAKGLRNYEAKPAGRNGAIEAGRLRAGDAHRDWYEDVSAALVKAQKADGRWTYSGEGGSARETYWSAADPQGDVQTGLGVLCLQPRIFEPGPVPIVTTFPPADLPLEVVFDHSGSLSGDAQAAISLYEWDLDGDGKTDFATARPGDRPVHRFPRPGKYTVRLTVTVKTGPGLQQGHTSQTSHTVQVSDRPAARGRLLPPPESRTGPVFRGVKRQLLLAPLTAQPYGAEGWDGFRVQVGAGVGAVVPGNSRFFAAALPDDDGGPPEVVQVDAVPAGTAAAAVFRDVQRLPADGPRDAGHRPLVVVGGLPPKDGAAALCLVLADGSAWHARARLRFTDGQHVGVCEKELTRGVVGLQAAGLLVFDSPQKRAWSPQGLPVHHVPGGCDEDAYALNVKLLLNELGRK